MAKEITTTWAHAKLTLGVDPTKYIHVLVPASPDNDSHLNYRFSTTASPSAMSACWSLKYRGLPLTGLELIFDRDCPQIIDVINVVKDSVRPLMDKRVIVIASDDELLDWLCDAEGRSVRWKNALPVKDGTCNHLIVEVTYSVDTEDEVSNEA